MSSSRTPNSRHAGQSIVRTTTGLVATVAIVGTGSLAFFVSHAYAGKTATTNQPSSSAPQSSSSAGGTYGDGSDYGYQDGGYQDGGYQDGGYQSPYQDPYAQQGGQGGYAPQPGYGGSPQATTGGS